VSELREYDRRHDRIRKLYDQLFKREGAAA